MSKIFAKNYLNIKSFKRLLNSKNNKIRHFSNQLSSDVTTDVSKSGSKEDNINEYDVVINGGGIVGFSTLLALKNSPFLRDKKICLIERQNETNIESVDRNRYQFSNRVSSITMSSKRFFQRIGVWDDIKQFAKPIKEFYVWSQRYKNAINFRTDFIDIDEDIEEDNDYVCYVIENNRILASIQSQLKTIDEHICYGTVVTDIRSDGNGVRVDTKCLKNDYLNTFRTNLLIGSDGFGSIVRQKSNIKLFEHDLQQSGIVGTVSVSSGDGNQLNDISFQRFVSFDNSVIALLPLTQEISSFVWSVPKDSAKPLMDMSDHQFVDHMNDTLFSELKHSSQSMSHKIDEILDRFLPKPLTEGQTPRYSAPHVLSLIPDSRALFPLKFSTTLPFMVGAPKDCSDNNRIVLIGDAAHRVHPLAGQGLNLGIGDADQLSGCLHNHLSRGESLFGRSVSDFKQLENCLFNFERKRQLKSIAMMSAIHSMQQLFHYIPPQLLSVVNCSQFLKQRIISFANNN